ncbi:MAG: DUF4118 domain-containing protein [Flavobacteriales bacterium]
MLLQRYLPHPYIIALASVVVALLVRSVLDPVLGGSLPFYLFYFAVITASIVGGVKPGLVALGASLAVAAYFFAAPRYSLLVANGEDLVSAFRFASVGAAMVVVGGWVRSLKVQRRLELAAMHERQAHVLREKEKIHHTLSSVGDGLITVDLNGRITFMNKVAEQLCGWDLGHAEGQYVEEVFKIVDGSSRETLPAPLVQAMRDGHPVGLPEHTVLIAKDGSELDISDSAAPIREKDGTITGGVLVFHQLPQPYPPVSR